MKPIRGNISLSQRPTQLLVGVKWPVERPQEGQEGTRAEPCLARDRLHNIGIMDKRMETTIIGYIWFILGFYIGIMETWKLP